MCFESVAWMNGGLGSLIMLRLSSIGMEVPLKKEGWDGRRDFRAIGCEVGALRRRASIGVGGRRAIGVGKEREGLQRRRGEELQPAPK